ncbi:MAG: hypothetical protein MJ252_19450, partial [archaeon]|nr:hypothetical protein [archaeon]
MKLYKSNSHLNAISTLKKHNIKTLPPCSPSKVISHIKDYKKNLFLLNKKGNKSSMLKTFHFSALKTSLKENSKYFSLFSNTKTRDLTKQNSKADNFKKVKKCSNSMSEQKLFKGTQRFFKDLRCLTNYDKNQKFLRRSRNLRKQRITEENNPSIDISDQSTFYERPSFISNVHFYDKNLMTERVDLNLIEGLTEFKQNVQSMRKMKIANYLTNQTYLKAKYDHINKKELADLDIYHLNKEFKYIEHYNKAVDEYMSYLDSKKRGENLAKVYIEEDIIYSNKDKL